MKRKINENFICIIYCLIIFISMYPKSNDYKNLANLESIIPGIKNVYTNSKKANTKNNYSLKSIEIIKKYFK